MVDLETLQTLGQLIVDWPWSLTVDRSGCLCRCVCLSFCLSVTCFFVRYRIANNFVYSVIRATWSTSQVALLYTDCRHSVLNCRVGSFLWFWILVHRKKTAGRLYSVHLQLYRRRIYRRISLHAQKVVFSINANLYSPYDESIINWK